jgi:hypothetical protein
MSNSLTILRAYGVTNGDFPPIRNHQLAAVGVVRRQTVVFAENCSSREQRYFPKVMASAILHQMCGLALDHDVPWTVSSSVLEVQ